MAIIVGQKWKVHNYNDIQAVIPENGEMVVFKNTPGHSGKTISVIGDGIGTITVLYKQWKELGGAVIPAGGWEELEITNYSQTIIGTFQDEPWHIRLHREAKLIHVYFPGITKYSGAMLGRLSSWDNLMVQALLPGGVQIWPAFAPAGDEERYFLDKTGMAAVNPDGVPDVYNDDSNLYPAPVRYTQRRGTYGDPDPETGEFPEGSLLTVSMKIPRAAFNDFYYCTDFYKIFFANFFIPVEEA